VLARLCHSEFVPSTARVRALHVQLRSLGKSLHVVLHVRAIGCCSNRMVRCMYAQLGVVLHAQWVLLAAATQFHVCPPSVKPHACIELQTQCMQQQHSRTTRFYYV
jgi:hypothetical protein